MNEWMNEWTNRWIIEWMTERMNQWNEILKWNMLQLVIFVLEFTNEFHQYKSYDVAHSDAHSDDRISCSGQGGKATTWALI